MEDVYILGKKARYHLISNEVNVIGEWNAWRFPFIVHIHHNNSSFAYDIWFWWTDRRQGKAAKDGRGNSLEEVIQEAETWCTKMIGEMDWYYVNGVMHS